MTATTDETTRAAAWPLVLNSILASTFGVVGAVLIDYLGRVVGGLLADRSPVLFHNRVELGPGTDLALLGGPAAALLGGIVFLAIFPGSRRHDASRLAVLWLILHCFRQGLVPLVLVFTGEESEVGRALATLDLPSWVEPAVGIAGALGLLLVALAAAPAFLAFAARQRDISTPGRRAAFVTRVALLPGIAGGVLAVAFFIPDAGTGLVPALPFYGLFTVATLLAALGTRSVQIPYEQDTQTRPSWGLLATLVVALVGFHLVLARGIPIPPDPDRFFLT
jgi:hypothetical protein